MTIEIETKSVNALRILSADTIQKANSGHPGLPLGAAPMAYELWAHHLKHNPKNPNWHNRDRFILSAGHGSALLYSLLHLFGYGISLNDLKSFRQLGSLTPGHPEQGHTIGVEATTGPLGAGMGMAVGMAMAEAHLAAVFNKPNFPIVDHYTYVLGGDGCMMEGISSEAFSLAGTLGLSKLIVLYDSNDISIEGSTNIAFTENVQKRMEAFGFQTLLVEDGNNLLAIKEAIEKAKADTNHPSFITIKTKIGYGCPAKEGKASAHGEPLGAENIVELRKNLSWAEESSFVIPNDIYEHYKTLSQNGVAFENEWNVLFDKYQETFPAEAMKWELYHSQLDANTLLTDENFWEFENKSQATRNLSGVIINRLKEKMPYLFGGSADLAPSNKTNMTNAGDFSVSDYAGSNIHFGVRELSMAAIANGICLHGGLRPFVATFFVFSDYAKPMMRLAALMKLPVTYVFTHDSIGVGEDGPTHEPIEQLAMLRSMPNINVIRPADATETAVAWYLASTSISTPTALILTRQNLPQLEGSSKNALKGGYIISDSAQYPEVILIATGSEVSLAIEAQKSLLSEGIYARVVSMPCMELFEQQPIEYQHEIIPPSISKRLVIEAASSFGWGKYCGLEGKTLTINSFGASAPADLLFEKFGFTAKNIVKIVKEML